MIDCRRRRLSELRPAAIGLASRDFAPTANNSPMGVKSHKPTADLDAHNVTRWSLRNRLCDSQTVYNLVAQTPSGMTRRVNSVLQGCDGYSSITNAQAIDIALRGGDQWTSAEMKRSLLDSRIHATCETQRWVSSRKEHTERLTREGHMQPS